MLLDMHPVLDHSLAVVKVTTFFLMAVGTVAVLEDVIAKVASTSVAVVSGTRSSKWSTLKYKSSA